MQKEHLEILLEQMDSKFDLVLESYEVLRGEIAAHGRRTDERFDLVDFKIDTLNRKIDAVDEKLSKQIGAVDEKLSQRIDELDERLSKRIDEVEKNLSAHIDAVAADLSAHRADTEAHHGAWCVKEK